MAEPSTEHDTIVVERRYAAAPSRVYAAWVEPTGGARWDVPGDGWDHVTDEHDVRVGGRDVIRFGSGGSLDFRGDTTYVHLVEDRRVVATYTMAERDVVLSVSVLTVELHPDGHGTRHRGRRRLVLSAGRR